LSSREGKGRKDPNREIKIVRGGKERYLISISSGGKNARSLSLEKTNKKNLCGGKE